MHFILAPTCIEQFDNLRRDYEKERKVDLEASPSMFGMPTVFGGTDVKSRRQQIRFLEKIKTLMGLYLYRNKGINAIELLQAQLMSSQIMIAACIYVQNEIGNSKDNSALYRLINTYLGVTAENFLDKKDKESCYQTAAKIINYSNAFNQINALMRSVKSMEFTEAEWEKFSTFILDEEKKRKTPPPTYNKYPVTTAIQPIFKDAFTYVGSTIGWVSAEAISNSSVIISPQLQLTGLIGSLLIMGPTAGPASVAFLAPMIASRLVSSFCTISMASILGKTMGQAGVGTSKLVGLPFDLFYNLLRTMGSLIVDYSTKEPHLAPITGIRIADGAGVIRGELIEKLQITETGELSINDQLVPDPENKMALVIKELNEKLAKNSILHMSEEEENMPLVSEQDNTLRISM
jgi:hypothetical protein